MEEGGGEGGGKEGNEEGGASQRHWALCVGSPTEAVLCAHGSLARRKPERVIHHGRFGFGL